MNTAVAAEEPERPSWTPTWTQAGPPTVGCTPIPQPVIVNTAGAAYDYWSWVNTIGTAAHPGASITFPGGHW